MPEIHQPDEPSDSPDDGQFHVDSSFANGNDSLEPGELRILPAWRDEYRA
jgi:hypothetical protein